MSIQFCGSLGFESPFGRSSHNRWDQFKSSFLLLIWSHLLDTLLEAWEKLRRIVVMVTHDIDEALYLADRLLLMTDGPEARIGEVLEIPFSRRRNHAGVLDHPEYYACRSRIIDFLENHARQFAAPH